MPEVLHFATFSIPFFVIGLIGSRRVHRWLFGEPRSRPSTVAHYRGLGPLKVTSISATDDEALVRLDAAAAQSRTLPIFVVCRTTGINDQQLIARWHRRRTLVWLQHDGTDHVVIFAGGKRAVAELWAKSSAA
jgi:hypothetical protein